MQLPSYQFLFKLYVQIVSEHLQLRVYIYFIATLKMIYVNKMAADILLRTF